MSQSHMMDQVNSKVVIVPQNFVALNRGDMYVPASKVDPNLLLARLATPLVSGGTIVHAIPVSYTPMLSNVRTKQAIGMATPEYKQ